jgi:hypothetical protein
MVKENRPPLISAFAAAEGSSAQSLGSLEALHRKNIFFEDKNLEPHEYLSVLLSDLPHK